MPYTHQFSDDDGQSKKFRIERYPTKCAVCGQTGQPDFITAVGSSRLPNGLIYTAFRCPITECRGLYVGFYQTRLTSGGISNTTLNTVKAFQFIQTLEFPPNIKHRSQKPMVFIRL
jgi:hypothetical protein